MHYRAEIDGLRAVAVVPVLLFHAGFSLFGGGYVGVDVFFVVSGFLITTIIINELDQGRFCIVNFYERRARRILPTLFFVIAVTLPIAQVLLVTVDMVDYAQSLAAVALFSSNILFWAESGYFNATAELKPKLYTQSLAVEEQYYILLMLTWCWGRQATLICLVVLFIASLALAQVIVADHPSAAFYLLPTRASELMVGSFVATYLVHKQAPAVLPSPTGAQMGSLLGLALIAYAVFAFDAEMSFPSPYTLVPVLGTALVILFAIKGTWVHAVLNSPIFVGIGLISCGASMAVMITLSTFLHVQDGMPARFAPEKRRSLHPLNALLNGKRAIIYSPLMPLAAILWTDRHGLLSGKATQWNWPMG